MSLPHGLSSTGTSQAVGWRILSPQTHSEGRAQAASQGLSRNSKEQGQRHFPVSPPHHPSGPCRDLEWKCASFAVPWS